MKRKGKGGVKHFPPLETEDLAKIYNYVDLNDNVKLQEKVFVDVSLYFGRRGRENICDLKISDFALTSDAGGSRFIYLVKVEQTKNHQDSANSAEGRMYATGDDENCPVKSFVIYKKHLNPKHTPFPDTVTELQRIIQNMVR